MHKFLAIVVLSTVLAACQTTRPDPTQLDLSAAMPTVPTDIQLRGNYRVPRPDNTQMTVEKAYAIIEQFKLSEEEKIRFINRLIQIIKGTRTLLGSAASLEQLQQVLEDARSAQTSN